MAPDVGERLLISGVTANDTPLLLTPLACTITFPVVAPEGTGAAMLVAPQLVGVAEIPLKEIVLLPWVDPKLLPLIVTGAPTAPEVGETVLMLGAGSTVNETPLLALLLTVTTTLPVVAPVGSNATIELVPQLVIVVALVPLNATVLVPWVEPKPLPAIVTDAPTAPEFGVRLAIDGPTA